MLEKKRQVILISVTSWSPLVKAPEPVLTTDLFHDDRLALLALLDELGDDDWDLPTACPGWSVHDVTLHLLGGDTQQSFATSRRLSSSQPRTGETIVTFINRINDEWLRAARRLGPRVPRNCSPSSDRRSSALRLARSIRPRRRSKLGGARAGPGLARRRPRVHRALAPPATHPRRGGQTGPNHADSSSRSWQPSPTRCPWRFETWRRPPTQRCN